MRVAVVGHTEWIDFIRVPELPRTGQIVHAQDWWDTPGGGGAVAAVQLAKLAGGADFFTSVGEDDLGSRAVRELRALGLTVHASSHPEPQRRAVSYIVNSGERTITVLGHRSSPVSSDPLPWERLQGADAVYLTAGDPEAIRLARRARVLVATARILPLLAKAGVELDALVGSGADPAERYREGDLDPAPALVVRTAGPAGGMFQLRGRTEQAYQAARLSGPIVDTYGCGDSFAAGLTLGLGAGLAAEEAVALAARCGAAVATSRGPYPGQLTRADLDPA